MSLYENDISPQIRAHHFYKSNHAPTNVRMDYPDAPVGEILEWLKALPMEKGGLYAWTLFGIVAIGFHRTEDAVAFRLRFGV